MAPTESAPPRALLAQLAAIRAEQAVSAADPIHQEFCAAASVLARFRPADLRAFPSGAQGWPDVVSYSEPVSTRDHGDWWRLRTDVRRRALRELGTRGRMLAALAKNPERADDATQHMLDAVLRGDYIPVERLTREEVGALSIVLDWVSGILPQRELPNADEVRRAVPMADLLAPMHRLAARSFVGRRAELDQLRDYVGVRPASSALGSARRFARKLVYDFTSRPPLVLYGPGGIGKSSLLARFILDHTEDAGADALPFVYLDVDRPALDPEQPTSFLLEGMRQLAIQLPQLSDELGRVLARLEARAAGYDAEEIAKSVSAPEDLIAEVGPILARVPSPILLIIDTFEEAQFLGPEVVRNIWELVGRLQAAVPTMRPVIAGRALPEGVAATAVKLGDLSRDDALHLLRVQLGGAARRDEMEEILDVTGGNPMSIRLAAAVVHEHGIDKLRGVETRTWLVLRVRAETVQARLYGRILTHIHDLEVKRLAFPGLVVRRITPDVVREVLAEPCGLTLDTSWRADELTEKLAREVALVERDPADGALCHRQDVRRLMLKALTEEVPAHVVARIHDRAVSFYERRSGPIARAEEIYHRLRRGDDPAVVDARWEPGVEPRLRGALEELSSPTRLWLSRRLGVSPDRRLLASADTETWEEATALVAQRYLQGGDPAAALRALAERRDRSAASPLFRLELEALRMQGRLTDAASAADAALARARASGDPALVRELLLQAALIAESMHELAEALARVEEADQTLGRQPDPQEALRVVVTRIRLLRKLGESRDAERRRLIERAKALITPDVLASLRRRSALFREAAAELGGVLPELLQHAIESIGLDIRDDAQETAMAEALAGWNQRLGTARSAGSGELADRAGLRESTSEAWKQLVQRLGSQGISRNLVGWRSALATDGQLDRALVQLYRTGVDASLQREEAPRRRARTSLGPDDPHGRGPRGQRR